MACEDRTITGGLLPEQALAAARRTNDARLLAGPGTGKTKTIVEHVAGLIRDAGVPPTEILCLTFTRAAAAGMRRKIGEVLGAGAETPEVYTLHAYALRVLMQRKVDVGSGKGRARVADDWEERWVVQEDLRGLLGETKIKAIQDRLKPSRQLGKPSPAYPRLSIRISSGPSRKTKSDIATCCAPSWSSSCLENSVPTPICYATRTSTSSSTSTKT